MMKTVKKMTKASVKRFRKTLNIWAKQENPTPDTPPDNELVEMRMILWSLEANNMTGHSSTINGHIAEILQSFGIPVLPRDDGGFNIN